MSASPPSHAGVVVPVRAFLTGKSRLAPGVDPHERAALIRAMATRVLVAAQGMPVVVVSSAAEVQEWAADMEAEVVADPGSLDGSAAAGRDHLAARGFERVVVAHADLPRADDLTVVVPPPGDATVVVVPDRAGEGNPVLSVPAAAPFAFAYGRGSFARHVAEAARLGLPVLAHHDSPGLRHDVDEAADLDGVTGLEGLAGVAP